MALEAKVKLTLVDKVTNKINQINSNINKMNTLANRSGSTMMKWPKVLAETANQAKKMRDEFKKTILLFLICLADLNLYFRLMLV